jgi:hypothetical protein
MDFAGAVAALSLSAGTVVTFEVGDTMQSMHMSQLPGYKSAAYPLLMKWAVENGATYEALRFVDDLQEGTVVIAAEDIEAGTQIASIPSNLLITEAVVLANEDVQHVNANRLKPSKEEIYEQFAIFLLSERRDPTSFWKPYLDTLSEFSTARRHPMYWNEAELEELTGTVAQWRTRDMVRILTELHMEVKSIPRWGNSVSFDELSWAYLTVVHNSIMIGTSGADKTLMVPFMDKIFTSFDPVMTEDTMTTSILRMDGGSVELAAVTLNADIKFSEGQVLSRTLKRKLPNYKLLMYHGMVMPHNSMDEVLMDFTLQNFFEEDENAYARKLALARDIPKLRCEFSIDSTQRSFVMCLSFLRLKHASPLAVEHITRNRAFGGLDIISSPVSFLSLANEHRVWTNIGNVAMTHLGAFRTTLEEDHELLKRTDITHNHRSAIITRISERELLNALVTLKTLFHRWNKGEKSIGQIMHHVMEEFPYNEEEMSSTNSRNQKIVKWVREEIFDVWKKMSNLLAAREKARIEDFTFRESLR